MIINRYLIREMAMPLVTVTAILIAIFMSYNAVRYTSDAAAGLLPAGTVIYLTLLRSLIAIEVLLPVAPCPGPQKDKARPAQVRRYAGACRLKRP